MSERQKMLTAQGIDYVSFPEAPETYWQKAAFDVIICLDSLRALHEIKPYAPASSKLMLWTHLPPEHITMLPLKAPDVQKIFDMVICETRNLRVNYLEQYHLPPQKVLFFAPTVVRSLRKRFSSAKELGQIRHDALTLGFISPPEEGLAETLHIFETLQAAFANLQLQIMLPPEFKAAEASQVSHTLLEQARQMPGIAIIPPRPWTSHIEDILQCHLIVQPVSPPHNGPLRLINALGAGCQVVAAEHASLADFCRDLVNWVPQEPAETFLQRFTQQVADCLQKQLNEPTDYLDEALEQVAKVQTTMTWDLRVWEWESLLYHLKAYSPQSASVQ